jgi:carbon monoxide dehydrogenase subunit G
MDLHHEFTVNVPVARAWAILTDLETIAPCLPGAQLTAAQGETFFGNVKVKVGPILAKFEGQATFIERDESNFRAVLKGEGRDGSGKGNASATITAKLKAISDGSARCSVDTDLAISGKIGQFGRGALADVSDKILAQFVTNLNAKILGS